MTPFRMLLVAAFLLLLGALDIHCAAFAFTTKLKPHGQAEATKTNLSAGGTSSDCFTVQLNEFFKAPVPDSIKEAVSVFKETGETRLDDDVVTLLTAAPGSPGVPRPLWLVALGSIPSGLLWYGYYKFAIEEELYQIELDTGKDPRGFGGYGTLGPFTYGLFLGPLAELLHLPGGLNWSGIGIAWVYYTQFLLYDRVNELYRDEGLEEPLTVWWCWPIFFPFNLIVGLRQVHFLAQHFYRQRGIRAIPTDPIANLFPFVTASKFSWQEFFLTPSLWCSLLSEQPNIDKNALPKPVQQFLNIGDNK